MSRAESPSFVRSAVWSDKREWDLAVRDIDLALAGGFPEDLRYKLLERKAHCLYSRGGEESRNLAEECVKEALEAVQSATVSSWAPPWMVAKSSSTQKDRVVYVRSKKSTLW